MSLLIFPFCHILSYSKYNRISSYPNKRSMYYHGKQCVDNLVTRPSWTNSGHSTAAVNTIIILMSDKVSQWSISVVLSNSI